MPIDPNAPSASPAARDLRRAGFWVEWLLGLYGLMYAAKHGWLFALFLSGAKNRTFRLVADQAVRTLMEILLGLALAAVAVAANRALAAWADRLDAAPERKGDAP